MPWSPPADDADWAPPASELDIAPAQPQQKATPSGAENAINIGGTILRHPFTTGVGMLERGMSALTSGAGSVMEAMSGIPAATDAGYVEPNPVEPGSISKEITYQPRTEAGKELAQAGGVESAAAGRGYDAAFGTGPLATTLKERIPQATGAVGTILGLKAPFDLAEGAELSPAEGAIEEGHPLTPAAKAEAQRLAGIRSAAKSQGYNIPEKEATPLVSYLNTLPRRDLSLPANAPATPGLINQAISKNAGPSFDAIEHTPAFQYGDNFEAAAKGVDANKIEPLTTADGRQLNFPKPGDTITGSDNLELSREYRDRSQEEWDDAENAPLRSDRNAAKARAINYKNAAKAVEAGYRDSGNIDAADNWDAARVYSAKAYAWMDAVDEAGNVNPAKLRRVYQGEPTGGAMQEGAEMAAQSGNKQAPPGLVTRLVRRYGPQVATVAAGALAGHNAGAAVGNFVQGHLGGGD